TMVANFCYVIIPLKLHCIETLHIVEQHINLTTTAVEATASCCLPEDRREGTKVQTYNAGSRVIIVEHHNVYTPHSDLQTLIIACYYSIYGIIAQNTLFLAHYDII
ncbi:hypothetical protein ACJX0J_019882, partial [Zea mays]